MFTDDIAGEMREQTDATDTRNASSNSERRDIHAQPDERPSSMYLRQSAIRKGRSRRSSLTSCGGSGSDTPEPEIEHSLAYTCTSDSRRGSIKRTKRVLPPDEPNEVHEQMTVSADLPGLFRNKLLTAAVKAEEDRKLLRDHTPESMKMVCSNSTVSSVHSTTMPDMESFELENIEEKIPSVDINSRPSTCEKEQLLYMEDKTVKSESCLLESNAQHVDSYVQRAQSAPVEVSSICTQTEWSWIEDMQKYEQMKSEMQSSQKVDETVAKVEKATGIEKSNLSVPKTKVKEKKAEKNIKDDDFEDELFRPPTVEYSSSSSDEDDGIEAIDKESFLPSIGPPKVLQYVKESVNPPFTNEFPDRDSYPSGSSKADNLVHSCAFCKTEVLEKIDVAQHVFLAQTAKIECPIYLEHLKQQTVHKEDSGFIKDEIIDVQPHPPFGTKAARKAAKERAAA
ncbi:Hypothetical predicted protein, partial [Paramuricea clavata]